MTTSTDREFYRAEELAKALQVNIMTIYRYINSKKIKVEKFIHLKEYTNENVQKAVDFIVKNLNQ